MGTLQFPAPGSASSPGTGITSEIASKRATAVVLRNSRIGIAFTYIGSIVFAFFAICMALMVFSVLSSGGLSAGNAYNAFWWGFGALACGYTCPRLWMLARRGTDYEVQMDGRGANFILGTKKQPSNLFLAWDQIAAIQRKRVGNAQQFTVFGKDGSQARYSSYTFFRPVKVARLIAERTGLQIQKV
jgi:hypothetical protein